MEFYTNIIKDDRQGFDIKFVYWPFHVNRHDVKTVDEGSLQC